MRKIFILITLLHYIGSISQNNPNIDFQNFQKAFPKMPIAPTTYSFIRQGEIPVSEYSGAINFSLNLYTIELDKIKIPLDLTYVGGNGIKVSEESSWVGLGWNLTLPTITQIVNDFDDLHRSGFIRPDYFSTSPIPNYFIPPTPGIPIFEFSSTNFTPPTQPTNLNGVKISLNDYAYYNGLQTKMEDIKGFSFDSEPDYFSLNLFGKSIKFISKISQYNQLYFECLNDTSVKIEFLANDNFKIIDSNGVEYYFENKEIVNFSSAGSWGVSNRNWVVTKIESNKNNVTFEYQNANITNLPEVSQRFNKTMSLVTHLWNNVPSMNGLVKELQSLGGSNNQQSFDDFSTDVGNSLLNKSVTYTGQNYLILNSINFNKGKVSFETSDRLDSKQKKLDKIVLTDLNNSTVKEIKFNYDYFESNISNCNCNNQYPYNTNNTLSYVYSVNVNYLNKRLKLNSINNFEDKSYAFDYNSEKLPRKCSSARDYWGYYNGKFANTSLIPNPINFYGKEYIGDNGNDLNSDLFYCKAGVLEKITYPTGGKSYFEYELNSADNFFSESNSNSIVEGSGLRVKSIINFGFDNNLLSKRYYSYLNGKSKISKSFFQSRNVKTILYFVPTELYWQSETTYNIETIDNNSYLISPGFEGVNSVGYDSVEVKDLDESGNDKGKIQTQYYNFPNTPFIVQGQCFSMPSISFKTNENGNPLIKRVYDKNNLLLRQEEFEYNFYISNIDYGVKIQNLGVEIMKSHPVYLGVGRTFVYSYDNYNYCDASLYGCYPIYSYETRLKQKKEIDYYNGNPVEKTTDYSYNNRRFLQSETTKSSDDTVLSKQTFYSFDRLNEPNMYELAFGENNFSAVVDVSSYRNGAKLNHFKNAYLKDTSTNDLILTKEVFSSKGNNSFERKVIYDSYDDKGNITQYTQEKGIPVSIIWGYNKTEIIAKVENLRLDSLPSGLVDSLQSVSDTNDEAALLVALQNFRSSLSPNTMITTFTHKPLIGVSTITDPKGDRITYSYDSYNRLKEVKDKDGNILSKNQYHFKN
jgi:YD repeat-containing protein